MKTMFSRQFALIAALLLVCMIFTGVSFRFLMLGYLKTDKKETLSADAAAVASLAEAYDSTGELEENWDFRLSLSLFSDVGEAEALVCDENGFVVLCSCDEFNCEHIGQQVDANLITEIDASGETFRVGTLAGIHDGRRYIAGRPIVANDTEETIGYVIISSDMTQITDFMQRSSSLFFYSAIIVLVLSMAAATFLSHQQVQPLNKVAEAARRFGRGDRLVGLVADVADVASGCVLFVKRPVEPCDARHHELALGEFSRQRGHQRQVVADLVPAAAGQQGDDRALVEGVAAAELLGRRERRPPGLDGVDERVALENGRDAVFREIGALEGEDDEEPVDVSADRLHPPFAPRPDLRGDVIEGADAVLFGPAGHLHVESRIVHQNNNIRLPGNNISFTTLHICKDSAQMEQHGNKTHVCQFFIMLHHRSSDGSHQITSEKPEISLRIFCL